MDKEFEAIKSYFDNILQKSLNNKLSVYEFLKEREKDPWYNYCEIMLTEQGLILYANPSHNEVIVNYCKNKYDKDIPSNIPILCSPTHYLVEKYNLVLVWHNCILCSDKLTRRQLNTINILKRHKFISSNYETVISKEYSNHIKNLEKRKLDQF